MVHSSFVPPVAWIWLSRSFHEARAAEAIWSKVRAPLFSAFRLAFAPSTDTKERPTRTLTVAASNVTKPPEPGPETVVSCGRTERDWGRPGGDGCVVSAARR